MTEQIQHDILRHVTHRNYQPRHLRILAAEMAVDPNQLQTFTRAVEQLAEAGQLVITDKKIVELPPVGKYLTGRFRATERGFGFVIPQTTNANGDLFIPAHKTAGALTNDIVRAEVIREKTYNDDRAFSGQIVEIIQRNTNQFVGVLDKKGKLHVVNVDANAMADPIVIRDANASGAKLGDKVVVEIVHWADDNYMAEGVITKILGEPGQPDVETEAVIHAYNLPGEFPDTVLEQTRRIVRDYEGPDQQQWFENRTDLRNVFTVTIDPPDARDYDDAISLAPLADGGWELGIHIADVAGFVKPDTALDAEAQSRGNSCYLPRRVIPMLPELLSNGICSLQPNVPRLAKSCFIQYDDQGTVQSARFADAVIESDFRLTYLEAQALIDGDKITAKRHSRADNQYTEQLISTLKDMNQLAQVIRKRRFKQGMIVLNLPEVELIFDDAGHVIDAEPEDDAFTHTLIEMFMVEANEAAARVFADLDIPLIRRIHPDPTSHDTTELRAFARVAGFNIPANPDRTQLQTLLNAVKGKPAERAVHFAVLKTLTKAEYAPMLIGHFALASEHYAHFTSPIRRYPDLTVHRALSALFDHLGANPLPKSKNARRKLARKLADDDRCPDQQALSEIASHCSMTERNAEQAERELRKFLVMQLLAEHVGESFDGTVTGITGFGVFVQIDRFIVEGLIRNNDLPGERGERWTLNQELGCLVAQRSGKRIAIGDKFKITINKVDPNARQMDLLIKDPLPTPANDKQTPNADRRKSHGKTKGHNTFKRNPTQARKSHRQTDRKKRRR